MSAFTMPNYLANMAKADYLGSSISEKAHVALLVKDTLCDTDGEKEMVLACFRAKCDVKRIPIYWEECYVIQTGFWIGGATGGSWRVSISVAKKT